MINLAVFVLLFLLLIYGGLQLLLLPPQGLQQLAAAPRLFQPPGIHKLPTLRGRTWGQQQNWFITGTGSRTWKHQTLCTFSPKGHISDNLPVGMSCCSSSCRKPWTSCWLVSKRSRSSACCWSRTVRSREVWFCTAIRDRFTSSCRPDSSSSTVRSCSEQRVSTLWREDEGLEYGHVWASFISQVKRLFWYSETSNFSIIKRPQVQYYLQKLSSVGFQQQDVLWNKLHTSQSTFIDSKVDFQDSWFTLLSLIVGNLDQASTHKKPSTYIKRRGKRNSYRKKRILQSTSEKWDYMKY